MSKFKPGQKVKIINVDNPMFGWKVGDTGVIEAVDATKCDNGCCLFNLVRMDTISQRARQVEAMLKLLEKLGGKIPNDVPRDPYCAHVRDDDLEPIIEKPESATWEECGFHPNEFLKEKVT